MTTAAMQNIDLREKREVHGLSQARLAEISGIPQHLLSAYELGKTNLPLDAVEKINALLLDTKSLSNVTSRKKRYREHVYQAVEHDPRRVEKYQKSARNAEYLELLKQLSNHKRAKLCGLKAVSLFAGCGGFSLGFKAAGIDILGFLEIEDGLRAIYKENFPSAQEIGSDITTVSEEKIQEIAAMGSIDMLIGGPPCQGFSLSGKRNVDDPRNELFRHYMRFVKGLKPSIAIIENVRLLTSMKSKTGRLVKDEIVEAFAECGYRTNFYEINAKHYGVPQHRERVIFVAIREDLKIAPRLPDFTHGEAGLLGRPTFTFADACSDLPYLESGEKSSDKLHTAVTHPKHVIDWLWDVAEGYSAHDNENPALRPPSGYNTTYKRQVWREPAATVQTTFGMISGCRNVHPIATRALTVREAARIQSFPDNYIFKGSNGIIRTGIGNAVPPLLAYQLAVFFRDKLL